MSIRDDLQKLFDLYAAAYQAGDATACATMFALNGELYSPYAPPARGRAAIEALHQVWTQEGGSSKHVIVIDAGGSVIWPGVWPLFPRVRSQAMAHHSTFSNAMPMEIG